MGYYSSLINRKFSKLAVEKSYSGVIKDYNNFLFTTDEALVQDINTILFPVDIFVKSIPNEVFSLLKIYDAEITLMHFSDLYVEYQIERTLGDAVMKDYIRIQDDECVKSLDALAAQFESNGLKVVKDSHHGNKWLDIDKISSKYDLIALSKNYDVRLNTSNMISPTVQRLAEEIENSVLIY